MDQFEGLNSILSQFKIRPEILLLFEVGEYHDMRQVDEEIYIQSGSVVLVDSDGRMLVTMAENASANSTFDSRDEIMTQQLDITILTSSIGGGDEQTKNYIFDRESSPIAILCSELDNLSSEASFVPILTSTNE